MPEVFGGTKVVEQSGIGSSTSVAERSSQQDSLASIESEIPSIEQRKRELDERRVAEQEGEDVKPLTDAEEKELVELAQKLSQLYTYRTYLQASPIVIPKEEFTAKYALYQHFSDNVWKDPKTGIRYKRQDTVDATVLTPIEGQTSFIPVPGFTGKGEPAGGRVSAYAEYQEITIPTGEKNVIKKPTGETIIEDVTKTVKVPTKDLREYASLTGEAQFNKAKELGFIPEDTKFVGGEGGEWSYIPEWSKVEEKARFFVEHHEVTNPANLVEIIRSGGIELVRQAQQAGWLSPEQVVEAQISASETPRYINAILAPDGQSIVFVGMDNPEGQLIEVNDETYQKYQTWNTGYKSQIEAQKYLSVNNYTTIVDGKAQVYLSKAIRDGVPLALLKDAGFTDAQITEATSEATIKPASEVVAYLNEQTAVKGKGLTTGINLSGDEARLLDNVIRELNIPIVNGSGVYTWREVLTPEQKEKVAQRFTTSELKPVWQEMVELPEDIFKEASKFVSSKLPQYAVPTEIRNKPVSEVVTYLDDKTAVKGKGLTVGVSISGDESNVLMQAIKQSGVEVIDGSSVVTWRGLNQEEKTKVAELFTNSDMKPIATQLAEVGAGVAVSIPVYTLLALPAIASQIIMNPLETPTIAKNIVGAIGNSFKNTFYIVPTTFIKSGEITDPFTTGMDIGIVLLTIKGALKTGKAGIEVVDKLTKGKEGILENSIDIASKDTVAQLLTPAEDTFVNYIVKSIKPEYVKRDGTLNYASMAKDGIDIEAFRSRVKATYPDMVEPWLQVSEAWKQYAVESIRVAELRKYLEEYPLGELRPEVERSLALSEQSVATAWEKLEKLSQAYAERSSNTIGIDPTTASNMKMLPQWLKYATDDMVEKLVNPRDIKTIKAELDTARKQYMQADYSTMDIDTIKELTKKAVNLQKEYRIASVNQIAELFDRLKERRDAFNELEDMRANIPADQLRILNNIQEVLAEEALSYSREIADNIGSMRDYFTGVEESKIIDTQTRLKESLDIVEDMFKGTIARGQRLVNELARDYGLESIPVEKMSWWRKITMPDSVGLYRWSEHKIYLRNMTAGEIALHELAHHKFLNDPMRGKDLISMRDAIIQETVGEIPSEFKEVTKVGIEVEVAYDELMAIDYVKRVSDVPSGWYRYSVLSELPENVAKIVEDTVKNRLDSMGVKFIKPIADANKIFQTFEYELYKKAKEVILEPEIAPEATPIYQLPSGVRLQLPKGMTLEEMFSSIKNETPTKPVTKPWWEYAKRQTYEEISETAKLREAATRVYRERYSELIDKLPEHIRRRSAEDIKSYLEDLHGKDYIDEYLDIDKIEKMLKDEAEKERLEVIKQAEKELEDANRNLKETEQFPREKITKESVKELLDERLRRQRETVKEKETAVKEAEKYAPLTPRIVEPSELGKNVPAKVEEATKEVAKTETRTPEPIPVELIPKEVEEPRPFGLPTKKYEYEPKQGEELVEAVSPYIRTGTTLPSEQKIREIIPITTIVPLTEGEEPIPEPEPVPEPTPIPEPVPVPEPTPIPEPEPVPEPTPIPEPEPVPEPTPIPEPVPVPEPTPIPEPEPVPEPTPIPVLLKEEQSKILRNPPIGTIVHPQGQLHGKWQYRVAVAPYRAEDIFWTQIKPEGYVQVSRIASPKIKGAVQILGGYPANDPPPVDMGIMVVDVDAVGKNLTIHFKRKSDANMPNVEEVYPEVRREASPQNYEYSQIRPYQGRTYQATVKANTEFELRDVISQMQADASAIGMDNFGITRLYQEPDGSYTAEVWAHNWNPFKWVKEKSGVLAGRIKSIFARSPKKAEEAVRKEVNEAKEAKASAVEEIKEAQRADKVASYSENMAREAKEYMAKAEAERARATAESEIKEAKQAKKFAKQQEEEAMEANKALNEAKATSGKTEYIKKVKADPSILKADTELAQKILGEDYERIREETQGEIKPEVSESIPEGVEETPVDLSEEKTKIAMAMMLGQQEKEEIKTKKAEERKAQRQEGIEAIKQATAPIVEGVLHPSGKPAIKLPELVTPATKGDVWGFKEEALPKKLLGEYSTDNLSVYRVEGFEGVASHITNPEVPVNEIWMGNDDKRALYQRMLELIYTNRGDSIQDAIRSAQIKASLDNPDSGISWLVNYGAESLTSKTPEYSPKTSQPLTDYEEIRQRSEMIQAKALAKRDARMAKKLERAELKRAEREMELDMEDDSNLTLIPEHYRRKQVNNKVSKEDLLPTKTYLGRHLRPTSVGTGI